MNRQRKVLITATYNELGIIIDTKAEEVAQPDLQSTCNQLATDCISRQAMSDFVKDTNVPTNDCISRQAAIEAVRSYYDERDTSDKSIEERIEYLPSAQPQRKTGKWIWWYEETFTKYATEYTPHCKCSECGRECAPSVAIFSNFCRNCGADMRGESDAIS